MGQSLKAVLQLLVLVGAITIIVAFLLDRVPSHVPWTLGFIGAGMFLPSAWLLWQNSRRKDLVPDHLATITPRYFERTGLCFIIVPAVENGVCWLNVFFQNRYDVPCYGRVVMQAPRKSFSLGRHPIPGIDVEFSCDAAGFGVHRLPWPIPANLQGKNVACEVAASVKFPRGRKKLVRFREGLNCGTPGSKIGQTAATAGLLLVGVIHISSPATINLQLPTGVAESIPFGPLPSTEMLDSPQLATGGFPIQPNESNS